MLDSADEVWGTAEMVLKVKEPVAEEYHRMREGQVSSPTCTWRPTGR